MTMLTNLFLVCARRYKGMMEMPRLMLRCCATVVVQVVVDGQWILDVTMLVLQERFFFLERIGEPMKQILCNIVLLVAKVILETSIIVHEAGCQ